ncbi:MAG: hypothetical protein ACLTTP_08890 [Alistipes ihumii]
MKKLLFILLSMMSVSAALRAGNEIRTTDPQNCPQRHANSSRPIFPTRGSP